MKYDFQNLSFDDFEQLTCDLLQKSLGVQLESFRTGVDGGIDLRYAPSQGGALIIQCKRYKTDAVAQLIYRVRNEEKPKLEKLRPARYVLSTSCALSPANKKGLMDALAPYCQSTADIFGADDLNALLREYGEVERRHFKLWLGSTEVLRQVIHAGIFNYSAHEIDRLRNQISKYVIHDGFYRALNVLEEDHHCIIVGIPGVGKTTAARMLLAHHLREGYEVISVSGDIEEAWRVIHKYKEDAKTIIYYDDFLGQMVFEEKMAKNEDRRLLDLIEYCRTSKRTRFILTTRDYVLDQALTAYEPLGRSEKKLRRSSVRLDDYGSLVRARLFANHLQFSEVGAEVFQQLVENRKYVEIIEHRNFLPRVVEQICEQWIALPFEPKNFAESAIALLNNPVEVWKRPFAQLTIEARLLVYTLASLNGLSESEHLESAWRSVCGSFQVKIARSYAEVLKETEGSFTLAQAYESVLQSEGVGHMVGFINPSAREFAHYDLLDKSDFLEAVIDGAVAFTQLVFWMEGRQLISRSIASRNVRPFADVIERKASMLLDHKEPMLDYWHGGMKIKRAPQPKKIGLTNQLFSAFASMGRDDLILRFVERWVGHSLSEFSLQVRSSDLTWLPEVIEIVFKKIIESKKLQDDWYEQLKIFDWLDLPDDMQSLRYVWDAIARVYDLVRFDSEKFTHLRYVVVAKANEIGEWTEDFDSADQIADEAHELEMLMDEVGACEELAPCLNRLRDAEEKIRLAEETQEETPDISERYGAKKLSLVETRVDDIFWGLAQQARECS